MNEQRARWISFWLLCAIAVVGMILVTAMGQGCGFEPEFTLEPDEGEFRLVVHWPPRTSGLIPQATKRIRFTVSHEPVTTGPLVLEIRQAPEFAPMTLMVTRPLVGEGLAPVRLAVPAGRDRVLMIEALDAVGFVLARDRIDGLSVEAGQVVQIVSTLLADGMFEVEVRVIGAG